jgi:ABC-type antimicrobial peptide transport system permease subunit
LFTAFGVLALVVAGIGVYSAMTYSVNERMHELGIRSALGASEMRITRLVVGNATRTVFVGIAVGVLLALAGGRLLASMLYAISPYAPVMLGAGGALLIVVAVVSSALPAWRATSVDPMIALRTD